MESAVPRPLGIGRAVSIAALTGLPWGLLFATWENVARMARDRFGAEAMPLGEAVLAGGQTAFWNAVVVCAFLAVVGAAVWAAVRSRGRAPSAAAVASVACAAACMLIAHIIIGELTSKPSEAEEGARLGKLLAFTGWVLSMLAGVGVGAIVHRMVTQGVRPRWLLAASLAAGLALFAWSTWSAWLSTQKGRKPLGPPQATPPPGAPNIVLIVIDAGRADALHCYGNPRETSPHLDRLAQEGVLYEQAFTAAPWTLPSHATMFTGKYPSEHGAHGEYLYLEDSNVTIAEVLHEHGYRTFSVSANGNIGPEFNTVQGFERFSTGVYGRRQGRSFLANQFAKLLGKADYGAGDGNKIAMRWIADAQRSQRPFFLFMNYMEVHAKYGSTPYASRWLPDAKTFRRALKVPQDTIAYAAGAKRATPEEFALLRALYDGDMLYLDERIGEMIEYLRTRGILDNTLLIVTSDHGEELGEHGLVGHSASLYNTVFRIPLIIRYPKAFPPGTRHKGVVETLDFFPTILDAAGIAWEGRSSLKGKSLLDKEALSKPCYAVTERFLPGAWACEIVERYPRWRGIPIWRRAKAIQDGTYKYLWTSDGKDALYDIQADPLERTNLIHKMSEKARDLKAALIARVGTLMRDTGEANGPPASSPQKD